MAAKVAAAALDAPVTWEPSVSYAEFFEGTYKFLVDNVAKTQSNYNFPKDAVEDMHKCLNNLEWFDLSLIIVLAIAWTILRYVCTVFLFTPVGAYCRLPKSEREKLPESAWKFSFYLCSWSAVAYILLLGENSQYFHRPTAIWSDYSMNLSVPLSIYAIYMAQISFYVHSLYTTILVDHWRRDSVVMVGHHVITALLLVFSLSTRCHRSGLIAIFLHDICDILLEGTKTSLYFKYQGDKTVKAFERLADIGFACFAVTWFVTRLYWFPLRHVYISSVYLDEQKIRIPFSLFFTTLLYVLLAMNVYWFSFILNLLYKVVSGQVLEDNRDYEEEREAEESKHKLDEKKRGQQTLVPGDTTRPEVAGDEKSGYFLRHRTGTVAGDVDDSRSN